MKKNFGPGENFIYHMRTNLVLLVLFLIFFGLKEFAYQSKNFPIFKIIALVSLIYFCNRTLKKLYYTYWTFGAIFLLLIFADILWAIWAIPWLGILGSLVFFAFLLNNYFIASPVYYPQVNWWEYDFRFRNDLKGKILSQTDPTIECRVADIRRNAASVHSFANFEVSSELNLEVQTGNISKIFKTNIVSKRRGNIGRPNLYGVHFSKESEKDFIELKNYFKQDIITKKSTKFKKD